MTVARIKTSTGWFDLTRVGPMGPAGPSGPAGPGGSLSGVAYVAAFGDGLSQAFVFTHNMGSRNVLVDVYRTLAPFDRVFAEVERTDANTITLRTTVVPSTNELTVVVSAPGTFGGYTHNQVAAAATWTITHNLNRRPSVTVVDTGDTVVLPDVHYVDNNSLTATFAAATSGKAYLN